MEWLYCWGRIKKFRKWETVELARSFKSFQNNAVWVDFSFLREESPNHYQRAIETESNHSKKRVINFVKYCSLRHMFPRACVLLEWYASEKNPWSVIALEHTTTFRYIEYDIFRPIGTKQGVLCIIISALYDHVTTHAPTYMCHKEYLIPFMLHMPRRACSRVIEFLVVIVVQFDE